MLALLFECEVNNKYIVANHQQILKEVTRFTTDYNVCLFFGDLWTEEVASLCIMQFLTVNIRGYSNLNCGFRGLG